MRLRHGLVALGFLTMATTGLAQPAAGPDAPVLQQQIRAWFASLLGTAVPLPEPPLEVTADGDQYRLSLPLVDLTGRPSDVITAMLRMLSGGRWSLDQVRLPSSGTFTVPPQSNPSDPDTMEVAFSIGEQSSRAVIDPTLATRSTLNAEFRDIEWRMSGNGEEQEQTFDRATFQVMLTPGADKRLDLQQEATVSGLEATIQDKDGTETGVEIRRIRQSMRLQGVNRDRLDQAWGAIKSMAAEVAKQPNGTSGAPVSADAMRPHLQTLIEALRDFAERIEGEETLDDLAFEVPQSGRVTLDQLRVGFGAEAPDGKLHAWVDVGLEGPSAADLPPTLAKYMFTRLAVRPALAGVSTERLFKLLSDAASGSADEAKLEADATAMLSEGGASIGLDALSIELADLRIEGSGKLRLLTPGQPGMEGRLSATGLDALMKEAGKDPDLQIAMPFLAIIRGLGRAEGDRLVWDLAVTKSQALVNGVDVMRMFDQPAPPPAAAPPGRRGPDKR